eukprot:331372_1
MSLIYEETLLPFIRICRTLEVCTSDETITFGDVFLKLLLKHNHLLSECTQILLASVYPMLSADILDELLQSLPTKYQQIDDSMSLNNLDDSESRAPLTSLLQIPKDLLIHTFQFLNVGDIYRIEKACRLLCVIAHNPNSLWRLSLDLKRPSNPNTFQHYSHYIHPRYAKIKILHFLGHEEGLAAHRMMMKALPRFAHLKTLCLNSFGEEYQELVPVVLEFTISTYLQSIQLFYVDSVLVFEIITKCHHLRTLILQEVDYMDDWPEDPAVELLNRINSCKEYPISLLNTLIIERFSSQQYTFQLLIYWILANGCQSKTFFVLDHHHIAEDPWLNADFFNHSVTQHELRQWQEKALVNVSKLVLGLYDFGLVNNISTWMNKCKNIKFDEFLMDAVHMYSFGTDGNDAMKPLHNIVSRSARSSFRWTPKYQHISGFTDNTYIEWIESEEININKHKWIVHDWPIAMLSDDLSCFDTITLSLHIDDLTSSYFRRRAEWFIMTATNVFKSVIKPLIQLKKSSRFKSIINYKLSVDECKWYRELNLLKDLCDKENAQGVNLRFECLKRPAIQIRF